ncbi:hypothetical protein K9L05_03235 [Candidatus Babeliales bacterium]|nr:hypothetical protein [Candidatus Babeliales bacterium]MCF7899635.1 hypothetical protein [Candidatus Babeliales bacterium]
MNINKKRLFFELFIYIFGFSVFSAYPMQETEQEVIQKPAQDSAQQTNFGKQRGKVKFNQKNLASPFFDFLFHENNHTLSLSEQRLQLSEKDICSYFLIVKALREFCAGKLFLFDGIAGNNQCHINALIIGDFYSNTRLLNLLKDLCNLDPMDFQARINDRIFIRAIAPMSCQDLQKIIKYLALNLFLSSSFFKDREELVDLFELPTNFSEQRSNSPENIADIENEHSESEHVGSVRNNMKLNLNLIGSTSPTNPFFMHPPVSPASSNNSILIHSAPTSSADSTLLRQGFPTSSRGTIRFIPVNRPDSARSLSPASPRDSDVESARRSTRSSKLSLPTANNFLETNNCLTHLMAIVDKKSIAIESFPIISIESDILRKFIFNKKNDEKAKTALSRICFDYTKDFILSSKRIAQITGQDCKLLDELLGIHDFISKNPEQFSDINSTIIVYPKYAGIKLFLNRLGQNFGQLTITIK